jgi:hypothetical protein
MEHSNQAAVSRLRPAERPDDSEAQAASKSPAPVPEQTSRAVVNLFKQEPSSRLIYLDEGALHAIALEVLNDPLQLGNLQNLLGGDKVDISSINNAQVVNAAYFARHIWRLPANEALIDIPPRPDRNVTSCNERYPGAMVRVRAIVKSAQDLRPDRVTLTSMQGEREVRIHVTTTHDRALSLNRKFMVKRGLYVVGRLSKLSPPSVVAAAVLLAPSSSR